MIDILLPVYNGEKYLAKQIDSILSQSYTDWHLMIRDDFSIDKSLSIISDYTKKYPHKIERIGDENRNLGVNKSFECLLRHSKSDYVMLCEQDDIWLPEKVFIEMREMEMLEKSIGNIPILICSDVKCINENDDIISESFFRSQKFCNVIGDVTKMAALNIVQGNTCLMNKQCLKHILPIPDEGVYDSWIGINICHYGKVIYIHQPLVLYRQHLLNVVGANSIGGRYFTQKLLHSLKILIAYKRIFKCLPFKINIFLWGYYKFIYSIKRLF